jgi:hypothetical protein
MRGHWSPGKVKETAMASIHQKGAATALTLIKVPNGRAFILNKW